MIKRHARELSGNQPILRFDVILQHDWPIKQCLFRIRVFFGGKTKSPCFDLFIHWLIKTNVKLTALARWIIKNLWGYGLLVGYKELLCIMHEFLAVTTHHLPAQVSWLLLSFTSPWQPFEDFIGFNGPYAWLCHTSKFHHRASSERKILRICTCCAWLFYSTLLPWEFIYAKLCNFTISKRGGKICSSDVNIHKGHWGFWVTVHLPLP